MRIPLAILLLLGAGTLGCATTGAVPGAVRLTDDSGTASYVASRYDGHATSSGVRYDERQLTAAHRSLPFGTRVRVTNLANGRSVVVTITDRGPFKRGRVIDVSKRAASELGFLRQGTASVRLAVVADQPRPGAESGAAER